MILLNALTALTLGPTWGAGPIHPSLFTHHDGGSQAPHIQLDVSDATYHQGDAVHVSFQTDADAYITIFRVDTDGRVRLLFPQDPWEDNFARGDRRYDVDTRRSGRAFVVDDYPGEGYVFAVASADPFDYASFVRGDHWDYRAIANGGRIAGDPYEALGDLIDHIVPPNYLAYSYDIAPYYVEEHYDYPRFLCYDCHGYSAYPYWNPYGTSCVRFRVVIYDDPFYYPARAFGRTRVVYARPARPVPRYVFKDRVASEPYIARVRERPVDDGGRRVIDRGATDRDFGGRRVPIRIPGGQGQPGVPEPRRLDPAAPANDARRPVVPTPERTNDRTAVPQPWRAPDTRRGDEPPTPAVTPKLERRESATTTSDEPKRVDAPDRPDVRRPIGEPDRMELPRRMPDRPAPSREPEFRRPAGGQAVPEHSEPRRAEPSRPPQRAEPSRPPQRSEPPRSSPPSRSGGGASAPPRRTGH